MKHKIESLLQEAINKLAIQDQLTFPAMLTVNIERPRDSSHGDFSSNLAMVLAKIVGMSPRVLAERLIACIPSDEDIAQINIAGPGFINFTLSQQCLSSQLEAIWQSPACGVLANQQSHTVVVDYSSPNLAKEMHVGHLRSTIIGDAIVRALELKGYKVIRQNHVGDWGTQFGMLLAHLEDEENIHPGEVQLNNLESFYKAAKGRFDTEPGFAERARLQVVLLQSGDQHCLELWTKFIKLSLAHCQDVYQRLGVSLQTSDVKAESAYNDLLPMIVDSLRQQGLLVEHEGAQCVFLDEFKGKDNELLPVIVQKKDGGFLYSSTDLAAIHYRQSQLKADRALYVVDARQALHFQQIFALAYKAGFAKPTMQLEHVSFGMVLDKSGKPFKSREGDVTKLADLLDESERRAKDLISSKQTADFSPKELQEMANILGISSIKYADLSKNRSSDYVFDWDTMLSFDGNTAPYLLYAYTRINSLFQKAGIASEKLTKPIILRDFHDLSLAKQLTIFPEIIDNVVAKASPHLLCTYLYELAGSFSSFYEACPILNQDDILLKESRLKLAGLTAKILELGLSLLGIKTLKRM
ncbi:Arginine--tRNA ligase [Legionella massiliensis]|uniref:Arginine--tRNA ligase n=1 Tax=Legionella massiliensis TaxID=1034943 RepID=A0A078L276_9GAMM|nr:arginine--tRNA ligase [Legionella massiliensis]CDZ79296.1 Arginine--tRNA ligase [Legionella massiliensis]CEE15034.1 Arginine--tRNA ligase [Legionella massiliensis]